MQERAMTLMGRKLTAAQAVEGRFSSNGLAALAGDGDSVELAIPDRSAFTLGFQAAGKIFVEEAAG